jgi:hypothetical protein
VSEQETESSAADKDDEEVEKEFERIEEDPPDNLEDWPGGKAKYKTFGGPEGEQGYGEDDVTGKLGPADLEYHEDGSVTVEGEEVDNPEDYKGEPIPGGPTDDEAPPDPGFDEDAEANQDSGSDDSDSGESGSDDSDSKSDSDDD